MKNIIDLKIDTEYGKAIVSEIYISELGYLMLKLYYPDRKEFKGYNLMDFTKSLNDNGIFINNCDDKKVSLLNSK